MSKMKEIIEKLAQEETTIMLYIPGTGYALGKVESIIDDVVTITPDDGNRVIVHYTQFSIERD